MSFFNYTVIFIQNMAYIGMGRIVRLTESDIHRIVRESVNRIISEALVFQHGATPHMELNDFKPKIKPEIMYKQFKLRLDPKTGENLAPGYVFPLYVNTEDCNGSDLPKGLKIGQWYKSGEGECWLNTDNNRLYTKGKGYKADRNTMDRLAYRPGWHLTTTPWGNQRGDNRVVGGPNGTGNNYRNTRENEVWAKVEVCIDIDATERAMEMSTNPMYQYLQKLGDSEYYTYKTNSNATKDQTWYIVDKIRIIDILDDDTVDSINDRFYADLSSSTERKINSDPLTYNRSSDEIPYWKMPRLSGKRFTKDDIRNMGYIESELTQL